MKYFVIFISLLVLLSCNKLNKKSKEKLNKIPDIESIEINDIPIIFNEERKRLSLEYLFDRYGLVQEEPIIVPKMIVLHWTSLPTLQKSFDAFKNPTLPDSRSEIKAASTLNVSAHFLVDQDGTIYRLMPETTMARHVIGLNHCAIGIENVGGTEEVPLTQQQIDSNIILINYLAKKYRISYLIGHYQYTNFEGHRLWLEKDNNYRTEKIDPGKNFFTMVRNATWHLKFNPIPNSN